MLTPFSGVSLLDELDNLPAVKSNVNAPLMMPISERYKDLGTIIVGKIEAGRLHQGDSLLLMPNRTLVDVFSIYDESKKEISAAQSGDNVRVRLRGMEDEVISPGFVLTSIERPINLAQRFEAQLVILDHKNIICAGYKVVMHLHNLARDVTLVVSNIF